MSIYFCQECQQHKDNDVCPVHQHEDGQCCKDCLVGKTKEKEMEKIANQVDGNTLELIDIDKRVKKLEAKKNE